VRIRTIIVVALAAVGLTACTYEGDEPTPVQPAESGASKGDKSATAKAPVKLTATRVKHKAPEGLSVAGGPYSCVRVTVTSQSAKNVEINPWYFSVTGEDGVKRQGEVGVADDEFDALTIAPGERAVGVVCTETDSAPKIVTFTDPLFSEAARAEVAE